LSSLDPLWTHNDFHASNLFWSDTSPNARATSVIDFGLADRTNVVYDIAQASLVRAGDYALCGKYLQPQKTLQGILDQYRVVTQLAATAEHPEAMKTFAQKTLANKTGLLVALLGNPQLPLSREFLLQATRKHEDVTDRAIDVTVTRLRRKLESDGSLLKPIRAERGVGYTFALGVEVF